MPEIFYLKLKSFNQVDAKSSLNSLNVGQFESDKHIDKAGSVSNHPLFYCNTEGIIKFSLKSAGPMQ